MALTDLPISLPGTHSIDLLPLVHDLQILDKNAQMRPFFQVINWPQQHLARVVSQNISNQKPTRVIVLKARQLGISTITEALQFILAMLKEDFRGQVVTHQSKSNEHLLSMTRRFFKTYKYRGFYREHHKAANRLSWGPVDSHIGVQTAETLEGARGMTTHFLHGSEVAFWKDAGTLMAGLGPSIPKSWFSFIILESTANGIGGWFNTTWDDAVSRENDYLPLFFPWQTHPEYTAKHVGLDPISKYADLDPDEELLADFFSDCRLGEENTTILSRSMPAEELETIRGPMTSREIRSRLQWRRYIIRNELAKSIRRALSAQDMWWQEYPHCVTGDTRVGTDKGLIPISEAPEATEATYGSIVQTHGQPPSPIWEVETKLGYRLRGTWDHPLFLESGMLCLLKSSKGQRVSLSEPRFAEGEYTEEWKTAGVSQSITVTPELARFMGVFVGDGSFSNGRLSVVCDKKDDDVVVEVQRLIKSLFDLGTYTREVGSKLGGTEVRVHSSDLKLTLDKLGLLRRTENGTLKRRVCVPESIWRSPKPVVAEFLKGLFEADGYSDHRGARIVLFSKYDEFIRDVQLLLLGFGITSRLSWQHRKAGRKTHSGRELRLRANEARRFQSEIGFISVRKDQNCRPPTGRKCLPLDLVDEVVSVKDTGVVDVTYDLTVQDGEAFDANGIKTHNTPSVAFLSSGSNIFPIIVIDPCYHYWEPARGDIVSDGQHRFVESPAGNLRVWKTPSPGELYVIGGDPTFSMRGDFACAQVLNRRSMEQVAMWRGKITPGEFGRVMVALGHYFNDALLAPESNKDGATTLGRIEGLNYPNIWQRESHDSISQGTSNKQGWFTNPTTKHQAIGTLSSHLSEQAITLHDSHTYSELRNYVDLGNGKFGNADGEPNDDTVMALAIASTVANYTAAELVAHFKAETAHFDELVGETQELMKLDAKVDRAERGGRNSPDEWI